MQEKDQKFSTSFSKDASWQTEHRTFFEYRDLSGGTVSKLDPVELIREDRER